MQPCIARACARRLMGLMSPRGRGGAHATGPKHNTWSAEGLVQPPARVQSPRLRCYAAGRVGMSGPDVLCCAPDRRPRVQLGHYIRRGHGGLEIPSSANPPGLVCLVRLALAAHLRHHATHDTVTATRLVVHKPHYATAHPISTSTSSSSMAIAVWTCTSHAPHRTSTRPNVPCPAT